MYRRAFAIVLQEGWQLALHSDLQPCLSKGFIGIPRSFSPWEDHLKKKTPPHGLVVLPLPLSAPAPLRGGMQVGSSPPMAGPS